MKFLTTFVGKVFPLSGRRIHILRAGIMEYWNVGMMGKTKTRGQKSEVGAPEESVKPVTSKQ
jgi:hypothetical protein